MSDFPQTDEATKLRRWMYALLITVVVGAAAGRILAVERVYEPTLYRPPEVEKDKRGDWPSTRPAALPTFSSNDRSRWATIRALVDHQTYCVGERDRKLLEPSAVSLLAAQNGLGGAALAEAGYHLRTTRQRNIWNPDPDDWSGWDSGWDTVDKALHPQTYEFYSTKPPLLPTLVAGLYWFLQQITGWTLANNVWEVVRTILLLVNVLPFALYLFLLSRLLERYTQNNWTRLYIMTAASFATLVTPFLITLNNHTVATFSVLFALYPALLILVPPKGDKGTSPGFANFLGAGLFAAFAACNELPAASFTALLGLLLLLRFPKNTLLFFVPAAILPVAGFFLTNYLAVGDWRPIYSRFGTIWYEFEGSHWGKPPALQRGIDFAREKYGETRLEYAFHVLLGHHGWFSLTPVWLLALGGMIAGMWPRKSHSTQGKRLPWEFYASSLLISVVVIGFYLYRSDNYGGWTCGLRWLMWLSPLWLLSLIPALEGMARYWWSRWLGYLLLAFSVLSVSYPAWNPWRHPWLLRWMQAQGWIPY